MKLSNRDDESGSESSFSLLDDDISLRSREGRCLLKLDVYNSEKGFSHCRKIHLNQLFHNNDEAGGEISYSKLVELVQQGIDSLVPSQDKWSISISYKDGDGDGDILIASNQELQRAIMTMDTDQDVLPLKVTLTSIYEDKKKDDEDRNEDTVLLLALKAMEARLSSRMSALVGNTEARLMQAMHEMQRQGMNILPPTPTPPVEAAATAAPALSPSVSPGEQEKEDATDCVEATAVLPGCNSISNSNMTREEVIHKFIADVWNCGNLEAIGQVCTPGIQLFGNDDEELCWDECDRRSNSTDKEKNHSVNGRAQVAYRVVSIHRLFEDYHCDIESLIVQDDKAFCRVLQTTKHAKCDLWGYKPTGQAISWTGTMEFQLQPKEDGYGICSIRQELGGRNLKQIIEEHVVHNWSGRAALPEEIVLQEDSASVESLAASEISSFVNRPNECPSLVEYLGAPATFPSDRRPRAPRRPGFYGNARMAANIAGAVAGRVLPVQEDSATPPKARTALANRSIAIRIKAGRWGSVQQEDSSSSMVPVVPTRTAFANIQSPRRRRSSIRGIRQGLVYSSVNAPVASWSPRFRSTAKAPSGNDSSSPSSSNDQETSLPVAVAQPETAECQWAEEPSHLNAATKEDCQAPIQHQQKQQQQPQERKGWSCDVCTYRKEKNSLLSCEMCGCHRIPSPDPPGTRVESIKGATASAGQDECNDSDDKDSIMAANVKSEHDKEKNSEAFKSADNANVISTVNAQADGDGDEEIGNEDTGIPELASFIEPPDSNATVDHTKDPQAALEEIPTDEVIPMLQECMRKVEYFNERRNGALTHLKDDLEAHAHRIEDWHKTVLDCIFLQTKTKGLPKGFTDEMSKIEFEIKSLESSCCALRKEVVTRQSQLLKKLEKGQHRHEKMLQKLDKDQSGLRKDIKTLIKALVKEVDKDDDNDDDSSQDSSSSNSSSVSNSTQGTTPAYITFPVTEKEEMSFSSPEPNRGDSPVDSLILYGFDGSDVDEDDDEYDEYGSRKEPAVFKTSRKFCTPRKCTGFLQTRDEAKKEMARVRDASNSKPPPVSPRFPLEVLLTPVKMQHGNEYDHDKLFSAASEGELHKPIPISTGFNQAAKARAASNTRRYLKQQSDAIQLQTEKARRAETFKSRANAIKTRPLNSARAQNRQQSVAIENETYEVKNQVIVDPYGEKGVYWGSLSNATEMPHGKGRLEYAAGRWYDGDWKDGRWTGRGRLSNGDGDLYEGELQNDHKHGKGTMRYADGRVFVGEYINGQMTEGKMIFQDGATYEGSWLDGMKHGKGKGVFTDGSVYEGEFREGEVHGHGRMSWSDGGLYEGEWWNGNKHGHGKQVSPNGQLLHEGAWSEGKPVKQCPPNPPTE